MTFNRRPILLTAMLLAGVIAGAISGTRTARAGAAGIGSIQLSPQAITIQNAAEAGQSAPPQSHIAVSLVALDTSGNSIRSGSFSPPIQLSIYGPPSQPLTAESASITSPTDAIYFDYSGAPVSNAIVVTAVSGPAFGLMVFQPLHSGFDSTDSVTFTMPNDRNQTISRGWLFQASLGGGPSHEVQMDTGSVGVVVPASVLGPDAIGPGPAGRIEYTSDGKIFSGHYYLTPLTLSAGGTQISTVPIQVLGVTTSSCDPAYPACTPGRVAGLGVMGVGFARAEGGANMPPQLKNPFLAVTPVIEGSMDPGYIVQSTGVTLGITSEGSQGSVWADLQPSSSTPGDWLAPAGCFGFPSIPAGNALCGTMLVDTGISSMILGLPQSQRPPGLAASIPAGTQIRVMGPDAAGAALSYVFNVGDGGPMTPTTVRWSNDPQPFVNTGRTLIAGYDYLFDAGSGRIGFRPAS